METNNPSTPSVSEQLQWNANEIFANLDKAYDHVITLHNASDDDKTQSFYQEVLIHEPLDAQALATFGTIALRFEHYDVAIELMTKALTADSTLPIYAMLGQAFKGNHELEPAEVCFKVAIHAKPKDPEIFYEFGLLKLLQNNLTEANNQFVQALFIDSTHIQSLTKMAEIQLLEQNPNKAFEYIQQGLALYPFDNQLLGLKFIALFLKNEMDIHPELFAFPQLVHSNDIHLFAQTVDIPGFNRELKTYIDATNKLSEKQLDDSFINVMQTQGNLLFEQTKIIKKLNFLVYESINHHIKHLPIKLKHPHVEFIPSEYEIFAWALHFKNNSEQRRPSLRNDTWLTGIYCVSASHEMFLELGKAPDKYLHGKAPEMLKIPLEPGRIVTFPSNVWHQVHKMIEGDCLVFFDLIPNEG